MVFMSGLTQEKQNIPVEPEDARRLRSLLQAEMGQWFARQILTRSLRAGAKG
jgi:hypothetical protein